MIIERDSNRRQRQQIYRKQLLNDIQEKQQQREIKNRSRVYEEMPKEEFSLIKNIEVEQERRKNKQKEYYEELERQRVEALELKKRKIEEERLQQEKIDQKIRRENEALKLKYEEEIRKQNEKKELKAENKQTQIENQNRTQKKQEQKQEQIRKNSTYPKDSIDNLNTSPDQMVFLPLQTSHEIPNYFKSMGNAQSYPYLSRVQNQDYNFPPRKVVNNSYYKELLREKRRLDEQTDSLRDLNRMIHSDYLNEGKKYSQSYEKKGGINQLKQISKLIYDQSEFYMKDASRSTQGMRSKTHGPGMMDSAYYKF